MNSVTNLSPAQLRRAADIQERILDLQKELAGILGGEIPIPFVVKNGRRKRRLSAQGLANIRAGVAKRMAGRSKASKPARKRGMSPAARVKMRRLMKERWAKAKKSGKSTL